MRPKLRALRFFLVFVSGLTFGVGLLMLAQVELLRVLRNEAENAGALWRGLGHLTFGMQDDATRTALWAHDVPAEVLRDGAFVAWIWLGVGFLAIVTSFSVEGRGSK